MPTIGVGQQYATGAVYAFAAPRTATGAIGTPLFLGTCEKMPQDQRQPEYEMLMNDQTGTKTPLDVAWESESASISLVLTRPVMSTVEAMLASPRPNGVPGAWTFADVGSLMMLEGLAWTVWLAYFFGSQLANKAAYTSGGLGVGMRPGRRYLQCILWAPQREETGTAPMKTHMMLYSWPYADFVAKTCTLFDYNMAGISLNLIK